MRLRTLLGDGVTVRGSAWQDVEITALATDSRTVGPGMLFAALPGSRLDGTAFIPQALARGEASVSDDPLALAPVVRIYNHSRHAFDLRSGRVFDGDPDVPALVRAALPVPPELLS